MAFALLFQLGVRNVWRQRRRNGIMLTAMVVAIAGVFSLNTLMRGMTGGVLEVALDDLTGHIKVLAADYRDDPGIKHGLEVPEGQVEINQELPLVGAARRINVPAVIMSERETRGVQLVGVVPADEGISFIGHAEIEGEALSDTDDQRLLIGRELATELRTRIGRRLVVITQQENGESREIGYRISGFYDSETNSLEELYVFTGLRALQRKLDTNKVTEVSFRLTNNEHIDPSVAVVRAWIKSGTILTWMQLNPMAAEMYSYAQLGIYILLVVILMTLVFGLVNALVTAVLERIREFGLLRAVGMRSSAVIMQVMIESMLLMTIAVILGLVLGYLIYLPLADGIDLAQFAESMDMFGVRPTIKPEVVLHDVITIVWFSLVLGLFASYFPARRAVKIHLLESLR